MKVLVTGSTGFIGNYVIKELLRQHIEVIATDRDGEKAKTKDWFGSVRFIAYDIRNGDDKIFNDFQQADKLIHLAWEGLPNYTELFHFEDNLMVQYKFLKKIIEAGVKDVSVSGTCFEYGMREGGLSVDMPSDPQNPYALAKDTLRKFLQQLQKKIDYKLKWIRLFYTYGEGQSGSSIISQLQKALENGDEVFNMSGGEQLRDYLPVEKVAEKIVSVSIDNEFDGIVNCSSGVPLSVRKLVETYLKKHGQDIKLNLGHYPYPDYEPMAFWGIE
ncbi:MAG: NAD(P)-dependent oxidoreductase [Chitinophagaceae bacterium]|nr:NAD(P)-dependent oxidoreductase [Chitinophagaceae bacterium]